MKMKKYTLYSAGRKSVLLAFSATLFCLSCNSSNKQGAKKSSPASYNNTEGIGQGRRSIEGPNQDARDNGNCLSRKIIKIAEDGKTIFSEIVSDLTQVTTEETSLSDGPDGPEKQYRTGYMFWDINSKKVLSRGRFKFNFELLSPNGSYFLRKLSSQKFQLLGMAKTQSRRYLQVIPIQSQTRPEFMFSADSRYLLIKSRPKKTRSTEAISIFDINERRFLRTIRMRGIKLFTLSPDGNTLFIGVKRQRKELVLVYTLKENELSFVQSIDLPRNKDLKALHSGANKLIVQLDNEYYGFGKYSGRESYRSTLNYFFNISHSGRYALVATDLNDLGVMNTDTGVIEHQIRNIADIEKSTCKISEFPTKLVCKYLNRPGVVKTINLETKEDSYICI